MLSLGDWKPSPQSGQHWVTDIIFWLIFLQFPVEIAPFSHIRKQLFHWLPGMCQHYKYPRPWHRDPGNLGSRSPERCGQWEGDTLPNFPLLSLQAQAGSASHGLGNPAVFLGIWQTDDQQPSRPGGG